MQTATEDEDRGLLKDHLSNPGKWKGFVRAEVSPSGSPRAEFSSSERHSTNSCLVHLETNHLMLWNESLSASLIGHLAAPSSAVPHL